MRKGTERLIFIKAFEVLCDADLPRRYCEVKDLAVFAKARRIRAVSWEELPLSMLLLAALLATGIVCGYLFAGNCAAEFAAPGFAFIFDYLKHKVSPNV